MITVSKSELKARMLAYFRKVEETGEELIVTDRSRPVLKITPLEKKSTVKDVFGDVRGKVELDEEALLEPETVEWGGLL